MSCDVDAQPDHRRLVAHRVDAVQRPVDGVGVADVADHQVDAGQPGDAVGVGRVDGGEQRVEDPHLVAGVPAGGDDVRADEARPSGDQDVHGG